MKSDFCEYPDHFKERYRKAGYWLNKSLSDHLHDWAEAYAQSIALVDGDARLSYKELDERVTSFATGLQRIGIQKGDRVLIQLPNSIMFVIASFALFRFGAIPIMCMTANRESDINAFCSLAEPSAYITVERFLGFDHGSMARGMANAHSCLEHIITDKGLEGTHRFDALFDTPSAAPEAMIGPEAEDVALLLLSGGTTGTPKLIPRTHADYSFNARASSKRCSFNKDTVYLAAIPVAHNFPLCSPGILGTFFHGGRVVMIPTSSADEAFPVIEREKVNVTALVPPLVNLWLEVSQWEDSDLSSLKTLQVGGSLLESDLAKRIKPTLGCELQQVFGMAEGLLCFTRPGADDTEVHYTQGTPVCEADEVRVVDEDGLDVKPGETGELMVRGPYTIRGYYRAEEHNARSFSPDGFYRSGDRVRFTPEGNIQVKGRIKDQINRAGEKISAVEVENHLRTHPLIKDAALVPLPDKDLGERSCAFIMPSDSDISLLDIHNHLRGMGVARHCMPDQLERIDMWPLTAVGKIDKRKLASMAK